MADIPFDSFEFGGSQAMAGKGSHVGSTAPAEYSATPEEAAAVKLVRKLFDRAKRARKAYDQHWLEDYQFFRGKQWQEQRPNYRHSDVINMVFQNCQASVPILSDSRPRLEFVPRRPEMAQIATILNDVAAFDWEDQNWLYELICMFYDAFFYGSAIAGCEWDPKLEYGLGRIVMESKELFYCFPDPSARGINDRRGKYFIEAEPVDIDQLKKEYPDKAKYLKPDIIDLMPGSKTDLEPTRFKAPVDNRIVVEGMGQFDIDNKNQCLKLTAYILSDDIDLVDDPEDLPKDPALAPEPDPNIQDQPDTIEFANLPVAKPKAQTMKKRYPKGRRIIMASGMILEDQENPYEDGKFPYFLLRNYPLPREFWGQSDIEQAKSPQRIFNKLVCFALDTMTLMGNPVWVVDTTSGIDTDNLFNRPGLVLEPEPGSRVERMPGVELQPFVIPMIDRMKTWFDSLMGSSDLSRGIEPRDVTAASAISALQEVAQTRQRQKTRLTDFALQDFGQLYQSRVFQFYSVPRLFAVTGNDGVQNYFRFHVEQKTLDDGSVEIGQDGSPRKIAHVQRFNHDPNTGQYSEDLNIAKYEITGEFMVKVSTGSSLPFARAQKTGESITLFKLGVIDEEELLRNIDYPNWEAVLNRMVQKKAAMQAAQAGQGIGPPAPMSQPGA